MGPLDLLWFLIVGVLIGAVAKLLMPGKDPGGCIITCLLGIAGSFVGGFLCRTFNIIPVSNFGQFIGAVIGAMVLLLIYRFVFKRSV
jgi:uncharacterized membrane protein YeaQ/YmgE (transglycosylase-associated protein family)